MTLQEHNNYIEKMADSTKHMVAKVTWHKRHCRYTTIGKVNCCKIWSFLIKKKSLMVNYKKLFQINDERKANMTNESKGPIVYYAPGGGVVYKKV